MADEDVILVSIVNDARGAIALVRFAEARIVDREKLHRLGEELLAVVDKDGRRRVVLNFTGVDFLPSAALNEFLKLQKKLESLGGRLRLCGLQPVVLGVFESTKLDRLFEIVANERDAMAGV